MTTEQLPFTTSSRSTRILAAAGIGAMALGAGFLWYFDPTKNAFFPACPLYKTTGFACPGCGMTRGFHALLHGDVMTALDFNALIPLFLVVAGYVTTSLLSVAVRGRAIIQLEKNLIFLWVLVGMLISFGLLRNLPYYPFTVLFP